MGRRSRSFLRFLKAASISVNRAAGQRRDRLSQAGRSPTERERRSQLDVKVPKLGRILVAKAGSQQVAAFATSGIAKFFPVEPEREGGGALFPAKRGQFEVQETPGGAEALAGLAEFEQQILGRKFHGVKFFEPAQQAAQLAQAHRAFLGHPVAALGKDIKFALVGVEFDIHAIAHVFPRLPEEVGFVFFEPRLGRAHQIIDWRVARPHFREDVLGGDAAVHDPDPFGLAVLGFDFAQEVGRVVLSDVLPGNTS